MKAAFTPENLILPRGKGETMQRPHKFDRSGTAFQSGTNAEARFKRMVGEYREATFREDTQDHFDVEMANGDKVDIKARKRVARNDAAAQDELIWVEMHGTGKNSLGWCYGGKAKYIAFETEEGFHMADREALCEFATRRVDAVSIPVSKANMALYRIYTRRDHDKLTLVRLQDLKDEGVIKLSLEERFNEPCVTCGHKRAYTELIKEVTPPTPPGSTSSPDVSSAASSSDVEAMSPLGEDSK